ncbi:heterokaryon incompatibility protein-domain-containing protein [Hypoxylon sp. FL0543]|nr:heterokaryon incompatibility protein-domain-containing protein [Hypoxylon sp. FL0543]
MRKAHKTRRLWIDVICINQEDVNERGQQVSMMSEIYKSSRLNLIYLGEEDGSSKAAFESIKLSTRETERELVGFSDFQDKMRLRALFERPWFNWVVQEAGLAPASMCFCGGKLSIDLMGLLRVGHWLVIGDEYDTLLLNRMRIVSSLWDHADDNDSSKTAGIYLGILYTISRDRFVSEPKDGVFAVAVLARKQNQRLGNHAEASLIA